MPTLPDRAALARSIAEASLLRGDFVLRSGRRSTYYLDKYLFTTRPEVLAPLCALFAERIERIESEVGKRATRLAGAELGGIPLVTGVGLHLNRPFVFIRNAKKDYGTARQLEGALNAGDAVILLEDVATTAGQALEAVGVLKAAGANVLAVIAAIDRQEGARENMQAAGLRFEALFTKSDLGIAE